MQGLLIFSRLNDLIFSHLDESLEGRILKSAKDCGLAEDKLTRDALVQLFSPLVATQRIMWSQMRNPYVYMKCANGLAIALAECQGSTFISLGVGGECELRHRAEVAVTMSQFLVGPATEELGKNQIRPILQDLWASWSTLTEINQSYVFEATEQAHMSNNISSAIFKALKKSLSSLEESTPFNPRHGFMLAKGRLLALYSMRGATDLAPADLLLLTLFLESFKRRGPSEGRFRAHVLNLLTGPNFVFTTELFEDVFLVVICESGKQTIATALVSFLGFMEALALGRALLGPQSAHQLEVYFGIIQGEARKQGPPSGALVQFEQTLSAKWGYFSAPGGPLEQIREGKYPPGKHDSLIQSLTTTLQAGYYLICLNQAESEDGLSCLIELTFGLRPMLSDFAAFLRIKGVVPTSSLLPDLPALVHFAFIDRRKHRLLAPPPPPDDLIFVSKLKEMVVHSREQLQAGATCLIWRDPNFTFCYVIWFTETDGRKPLKPVSEIRRKKLPRPGLINGDFYSQLVCSLFPSFPKGKVTPYELYTIHLGPVDTKTVLEHGKKIVSMLDVGPFKS
ncbi:unnamed protein product [Cyprideis torosa]|uniref:Uncharacterized protein n=1 Tax=Cyprideis torosa TaxID=163714 RepID=A0A7R8W3U2_9CRUS|nr:unnamed protein product [Cyprideis torosa]CAG0879283.1 unnamed protein product [Cyprideis torosa]